MKMYEVGGCVRDEILGIKSKDIDFSVVLDTFDFPDPTLTVYNPKYFDPFEIMEARLRAEGFELFDGARAPEHFTARGRFPKTIGNPGTLTSVVMSKYAGMAADFVLARKEGEYSDGRRPDSVEIGTLEDDLARRDFTMNAIAKTLDGIFIDPHNGRQDINEGVIRAVGSAFDRLSEDALRAVRAIRFSVTKGFRIDREVEFAMESAAVLDSIQNKISDERICDELSKMFRYDTLASMSALSRYPALTRAMFSGSVSLDATMKTKGRGK